jgi:hypothetical protein
MPRVVDQHADRPVLGLDLPYGGDPGLLVRHVEFDNTAACLL